VAETIRAMKAIALGALVGALLVAAARSRRGRS
jgi:hypothetical protein